MSRQLSVQVGSVGGPVDPATGSAQPAGKTGYTLVASEEFGGVMAVNDAPNGLVTFRPGGNSWATWYPNWPRFNSQTPGGNHTNTSQLAYFDTSKVSLSGGALQLACDLQTTVAGLPYTAGMIQSLPSITAAAGFFEARIKLDARQANGWPAWWMSNSATDQWPPEIDIWEWFGNGSGSNNTYGTNTYITSLAYNNAANNAGELAAWHTYGCEWRSGAVTFYLDGVQTGTTASSPGGSQYLLLNNGAQAGATFPSMVMSVDYVRYWG